MSEPAQVPRQFKSDFMAVCRTYLCSAEEVAIMKELARKDLPAASESFGIMAGEVAA